MALAAHAATLGTRVPFLHFFDGFRTSHETAKIESVGDDVLRAMIDDDLVSAHRERSLNPNRPVLRGTAQNPDVFFQAREASNPFYDAVPSETETVFDKIHKLTGRRYRLFEYAGAPDAERVVVLMGSGFGAAVEAVEQRVATGEKVGLVGVRLYRPFAVDRFLAVLPESVRRIAVLDRTKEPGAPGEPLYLDVVSALHRGDRRDVDVIGGRYGLSSKEFTPAMAAGVFEELARRDPRNPFTVGIQDDVTHLSLSVPEFPETKSRDVLEAVFFGLGSDGTVGANKNSVKIVGTRTDRYAQGYYVYDSKKSGAMTVSHLRFSPRPIRSSYLIEKADFVACHQSGLLGKVDVLDKAADGAVFLLNSPHAPDRVWGFLPYAVRRAIVEKQLRFFVVDGHRVAREAGLAGRINTVLQTCFFLLTDLLPSDQAVEAIRDAVRDAYGKRSEVVLERNFRAIEAAAEALHEVRVPGTAGDDEGLGAMFPEVAPDFVQRVTSLILQGKGDLLPVSALPVDGTFPTGTARWEKRGIASQVPVWDPEICVDCGRCALVCPHAAIRLKVYEPALLAAAPEGFLSKRWKGREHEGLDLTVQVAPDDCTGCGVCVDVCPAHSKEEVRHRSINMEPRDAHLRSTREGFEFFLDLPAMDRESVKLDSVKGSQLIDPLFEFSGACAGCGETPYVKLLSQLFGDRIIVANATGCSSIYGGNLPTTPWSQDGQGRGPAWSNSLFEDNAEFGLGMQLGLEAQSELARRLLGGLRGGLRADVGSLAAEILDADQTGEAGVARQRERVALLRKRLATSDDPAAPRLAALADHLVRTGVWILGGDGWAYDIGFGGLDHVLALGRNVNVLVLDTEVYSNTGGQASKATPRAAVAKFAAGGKATGKKDLGMLAMNYGNVYVAQVAMGANMTQTVKAFTEAEAHPGPSVIIAYSPCIAHGIEMRTMMTHQKEAAGSGYWPLYRYDPAAEAEGRPSLRLDSRKPTMPFREFAAKEGRFAMLALANPAQAEELIARAQQDIDNRWQFYEQMVHVHRTAVYEDCEEEL